MAAAEALMISRDIDDTVKDVDQRLKGVAGRVKGVNHRVRRVDHKVVSVIKGTLRFLRRSPNQPSTLYSIRCNGDRICDSKSVKSSQLSKLFVTHQCSSRILNLV